jgi:hypothetical protein
VSRHKSTDVLQAYVRDADLFRDHAVPVAVTRAAPW